MKFEKLKVGDVVFDVGSQQCGNTTLRTVAVWKVRIISINPDRRSVEASWNGNPSRTFYERSISKWRAKAPLLISTGFGRQRLATREEIAARKVTP